MTTLTPTQLTSFKELDITRICDLTLITSDTHMDNYRTAIKNVVATIESLKADTLFESEVTTDAFSMSYGISAAFGINIEQVVIDIATFK